MTIIVDSKILAYTEMHRKMPIVNLFASLVPVLQDIECTTGRQITKLIFVYDIGKSSYRLGLWPKYKGKRAYSTVPENFKPYYQDRVPKMASLLGIKNFLVENVEADDLAGVLCNKLKEGIVLVTNDHDYLQLPLMHPERVSVYLLGKRDIFGHLEVQELTGCKTEEQFLIKKAVLGDSGDNIIGIPAVGEVKFGKWAGEHFHSEDPEYLKDEFLKLCHKPEGKLKTHKEYTMEGVHSCEELYDFNMALGRIMTGVKFLDFAQKIQLNVCYANQCMKSEYDLQAASDLSMELRDGLQNPFGGPWYLTVDDLKIYERIANG